MPILDPINATITFNVALRVDEEQPVLGVLPIQLSIHAAEFAGTTLLQALQRALMDNPQVAAAAERFHVAFEGPRLEPPSEPGPVEDKPGEEPPEPKPDDGDLGRS